MRLVRLCVGRGLVAVVYALYYLLQEVVLYLCRHGIVFQKIDTFAQRYHCLLAAALRLCLCELRFQCFDAVIYLLPPLLEFGKVINPCFVGIACTPPSKLLLLERCVLLKKLQLNI